MAAEPGALLEHALFEVKKVVVGQDQMLERMMVALLARGHVLLEGVPGVAKSLAVDTVARVIGGTSVRLQFTLDLVPSDIVGTRIYRPSQEDFDVELGPVFANLVLADEINRAPAKLSDLASTTGGKAYRALTGQQLKAIYADITARAGTKTEQRPMAGALLGLGLLSAIAASATSLVWFRALP